MFGRSKNNDAPAAPVTPSVVNTPANDLVDVPQQLWAPPSRALARKSVEALLMERGHVTAEQMEQAKNVQAQTPGKSIAQILLTMNAASEAQILAALAETLGLAFEQPPKEQIDPQAYGLFPTDYVRKHNVIGLRLENDGKTAVVGMTDPNNVFLIDELKRKTKRDVKVVVTTALDIARIIEQMSAGAGSDMKVDDIIKDMAEDDVQVVKDVKEDDVTDLEKMGSESPVIRF